MLREIVLYAILIPAIEFVSNPDTWNRLILDILNSNKDLEDNIQKEEANLQVTLLLVCNF